MSLFDTIFNNSSHVALNPLFSSSSKFTAKAAAGSVTAEPLLVDEPKAGKPVDEPRTKAGKPKKRKIAETIEVPPVELPVKQNKQKRHADTVSSELTPTKKKQKVVINDADSSSADKVKPAKKQKQSVQRSAAPASANAAAAPSAAASEADVMVASDPQLAIDHKVQVEHCAGKACWSSKQHACLHQWLMPVAHMLMRLFIVQRLSPEEEAAKLRRTVFVGNLPSDVKRKMIQKEFER